jgi:hypothetical protein
VGVPGPAHLSHSVLGVAEAIDDAITVAPAPTGTKERGSGVFLIVASRKTRLRGRARKACLYTIRRSKWGNGTSRARPRGPSCRATRFRTRKKQLETVPPCRFSASGFRSAAAWTRPPTDGRGAVPQQFLAMRDSARPAPVATLLPMPVQHVFIFEGRRRNLPEGTGQPIGRRRCYKRRHNGSDNEQRAGWSA